MVKTYSLKNNGNEYVTENFQVKEFACKDGSDEIKIDTVLVDELQKYRNSINKPIIIISGYRTKSHNEKVNGAPNSYHINGMAVQINVEGINCKEIAHWFYVNSFVSIGIIDEKGLVSVHLDNRDKANRYFFESKDRIEKQVKGF